MNMGLSFMRRSHVGRMSLAALLMLALLVMPRAASGQDENPEAADAFRKMIETYRKRPALKVRTSVSIELTQGGMTSEGSEIEATFLFGRDRQALVTLRGFTCLLTNGELIAVHEGNEHSYYRGPDDDSPYYALFAAFLDMPFPHLAIYLGEDAMDDLYMQIHPIAPEIVPTSVRDEPIDGKPARILTLSSDHATLELRLHPRTLLIQSAELNVSGGPLVQPGVSMRYTHEFEYETHDQPLPVDALTLDTTGRQRVTMLATLQPPPPAPQPMDPAGAAAGPGGGGDLAGEPAPEFTLATLDGDAVDLAELRGKIVVLDFWATWCPPCVKALPLLHEVARWARDEQLPVEVMTVNTYEGARLQNDTPDARLEAAENFWKQHAFTLPVLMDYTDETAASYGVSSIPTTVVIRADGVVHAVRTGFAREYAVQLQTDIRAAIDALDGAAEQ